MIFRHFYNKSFLTFLVAILGCFSLETKPKTNNIINDFSRLNQTTVQKIISPNSYQDLQKIIKEAHNKNLKIAISGIRHSQGGHAFFPNAIVINLEKLNSIINFDKSKQLLTVQAGATWSHIQEFLHPQGYAVKIMQFANLFTVGGSLSVNCNGVDPSCGPLIESIESIKILLENGSIITASRTQNSELFALAIGGYGLFGIILEATMHVVPDDLYAKKFSEISLDEYAKQVKKRALDFATGFHFAFLKLTGSHKKLFDSILCFDFKKLDSTKFSTKKNKSLRKFKSQKFTVLNKWGTWLWSKSKLMKARHWLPNKFQQRGIISRNNIMSPPAAHLYVEMLDSVNLLQEYFIPVENLTAFIKEIENATAKFKMNIMHIALRFIPKNTESFLNYTSTDRIGIVIFFNQKFSDKDHEKTKLWTQYLIDQVTQLKGAYYLPIQLHATKVQAICAYPKLNMFFALKRKYDPSELFMNYFYQKYAF